MTTALIEARGITVSHGATPALADVDFRISPGEIVTVIGPNGSGKSTLIKALIGLLDLDSGEVIRRSGLRIGYVAQSLKLDPSLPMTVRRFLSLPRRVRNAEAERALERTGVAGLGGRMLTALSGGQFQRVLLARALLGRPDILILDEATQGLDQPGIGAFYRLIEEVRAETGAAVLMVSHDLHVVMSATDRVLCLNGHVCCEGSPQKVTDAPEYRALFGMGTQGTFALYQHQHDHVHDGAQGGAQGGAAACSHDHGHHAHHAREDDIPSRLN